MTNEFKDFIKELFFIPLFLIIFGIGILLFIPTLGHSWKMAYWIDNKYQKYGPKFE